MKYLSCLLALILAACGSEVPISVDSDLPVVRNAVADAPGICTVGDSPGVTIGTAEGEPEYQLHRVFQASRLSDGRIAVVNQGTQELRYYDADGTYLSASGGAGEGPGEFKAAFLVWRTEGDSLWVGDYRPWEFEVFGPDGTWTRGVRLKPDMLNPPQPLGVLASGYSIVSTSRVSGLPRNFEPRKIEVVAFDPHGNAVDTLGVFEGNRYGQVTDDSNSLFVSPLFEAGFDLSVGPDRIALGKRDRAEVTVYGGAPSFEPLMTVAWDIMPRPVTQGDVTAEYDRIQENATGRTPDEYRLFIDPRIHPDRPVADTFPAIGAMHFATDGTLWIRTYRQQAEREGKGDLWLAFDPEGRLSCTMEAPMMSVSEIGLDYVLVESEGSQGEELVELYSLSRPNTGS